MAVNVGSTGDPTVYAPSTRLGKGLAVLRPAIIDSALKAIYKTENAIIHSPSILPSPRGRKLARGGAQLLHLHWVQNEMIPLTDMGRLPKPAVWTLHDMWAFCGAEHVNWDGRWEKGYRKSNRPSSERGPDINRWVWERKRKHWQTPLQLITPSTWLRDCVKRSALLKDWPVTVIPNCIDTALWHPIEQRIARSLLGLPQDVPLMLFGTADANGAHHKGFDLLQQALGVLRGEAPGLELVIFGEVAPKAPPRLGFPLHYTGRLHDELSLRMLYNAVDLLAVPSRIDNLPNTAVEAMACGTPVVAFETCGLPDLVIHKSNGYLARSFDPEAFAEGVRWVLSRSQEQGLREAARAHAVSKFSEAVVVEQHLALYQTTLATKA
jgi:glycosyltransferase involved in cell wall biosynthesis